MKYLGVDYGSKRVGFSVSDSEGRIAFPRGTVPNDAFLMPTIMKLISEEKITAVVVGDTRALNGGENPVTKEAEDFIGKLAKASGLPVLPAFEGWSSIEASRYAPEGAAKSDAAAAAVILQRFLDMNASR